MSRTQSKFRRLVLESLEDRRLLTAVPFHWGSERELAFGPEPPAIVAEAGSVVASANLILPRFARFAEAKPMGPVEHASSPLAPSTLSEHVLGATYSVARTADRFLQQHRHELGVAEPDQELLPYAVDRDQLGMTHVRYSQVYEGIPVGQQGTGIDNAGSA